MRCVRCLRWHAEASVLRCSHLNRALALGWHQRLKVSVFIVFLLALHLIKCTFQVRSGGTRCEVFALSSSFTVSNFRAISLARFLFCGWLFTLNSGL